MTEIEEMHTRLTSVLRERTEFLKSSVDKYLIVESKTLKDLKENLELELANIKVSSILLLKTYYAKKPMYYIKYNTCTKYMFLFQKFKDIRLSSRVGGRHGQHQHLFQKVIELFFCLLFTRSRLLL